MPDFLDLMRIVEEALSIPLAQRSGFLKKECKDDDSLFAAAKRMLDAEERAGRALNHPETAPTLETPGGGGVKAGSYDFGASSHRFRILKPHAKGGLGEVFVAEDGELRREVALKEIQPKHADDPGARSRFVFEAEVTGGLEHPGVVPVYGLGTHEDGRPFYAMRFVKGDDLRAAIRKFHEEAKGAGGPDFRSTAFRGLLRRFLDVCNALGYAHSRGVLHRDIKPGNIMLGPFGETLVVDWGLAKIVGRAEKSTAEATLNPSSGDSKGETMPGRAIGTPGYMSPEQADGRIDELGPATDVYALGAVLHSLLTGNPPVATDGGYQAILDRVRTGTLLDAPGAPKALAAISTKAMALRATDRYATTADLAADVERWLADEPVSCHREPWTVRFSRWRRKHPLAVGVTAAGGLTAIIALAVGLAAVNAERGRTVVQRDRAVEARKTTRAAFDAMTSKITEGALKGQQKLTPEQEKFLNEVVFVYRQFAGEDGEDEQSRLLIADAAYRVGGIEQMLRRSEPAAAALQSAATDYAKLSNAAPDNLIYRRRLATARYVLSSSLIDLGKASDAINELKSANSTIESIKDLTTSDRSDVARNRQHLAYCFRLLGKRDEQERELKAAQTELERLVESAPEDRTARDMLTRNGIELAMSEGNRGDRAAAMATSARTIEALERGLKKDGAAVDRVRDLSRAMGNLAGMHLGFGENVKAEELYRKMVENYDGLIEKEPGIPDHRFERAQSMSGLGIALERQSRWADAEAQHRKSVADQSKLVEDLPHVPIYRRELARMWNGLAVLHFRLRRFGDAEKSYREAVATLRPLIARHPDQVENQEQLGRVFTNLSALLSNQNKHAEAAAAVREAIDIYEKVIKHQPTYLPGRLRLADALNTLGTIDISLVKHAEAEAALRRAISLYDERVSGPSPTPEEVQTWASSHANLAATFLEMKKFDEAVKAAGIAIDKLTPMMGKPTTSREAPRFLRNAHRHRAVASENLGDFKQAVKDWNFAVQWCAPEDKNGFRYRLGRAHAMNGDADAALVTARDIAAKMKTPSGHFDAAKTIALAHSKKATSPEAESLAKQAIEFLREAKEGGLFTDPEVQRLLKEDADFATIRRREDFKMLVEAPKSDGKK